jgi:hypothetical protein
MEIEKVNLKDAANSYSELFKYLKVDQLNDHMLNIIQAILAGHIVISSSSLLCL